MDEQILLIQKLAAQMWTTPINERLKWTVSPVTVELTAGSDGKYLLVVRAAGSGHTWKGVSSKEVCDYAVSWYREKIGERIALDQKTIEPVKQIPTLTLIRNEKAKS